MTGDKKICDDCGKIHVTRHGAPACRAHLTGTGKTVPCSRPPIVGGFVCRTHGGALTLTKVAAAKRIALMAAQGEIADLMRDCDIPDQHPIDGLLEVVRVSGSMMRLLTVKVGELAENPTIQEVLVESKGGELSTKRVAGEDAFWGLNHQGEMAPSIYVDLLKTWTERYERACKTALEAGIEERRVQLAEDTSETFFKALGKAVSAAGLDPDARATLNLALANELRKSSVIDVG
jgi:hypothetical protein